MKRTQKPVTVLVLHNIRSVHNVGAIFRTAEAVGISLVILSGYTPSPLDKFGKWRTDFAKTALGAERVVPWKKVSVVADEIIRLKQRGFLIVGVEQDKRAIHYRQLKRTKQMAVVLGNEVRGLSSPLRAQCDKLVEIPMRGNKESLNVAVAAGVVLYGIIFC